MFIIHYTLYIIRARYAHRNTCTYIHSFREKSGRTDTELFIGISKDCSEERGLCLMPKIAKCSHK